MTFAGSSQTYNLAGELEKIAARKPFMPGIIFPAGKSRGKTRFIQYSFQQLNTLVDQYAHGFTRYGIRRGERTLVMLKPGAELIACVFALIKIGAVPILIDPGMGRKAFLQCILETAPTAMLGIPLAHLIKRIFPAPFKQVTKAITTGPGFWKTQSLKTLRTDTSVPFPAVRTTLEEESAIAFTSGGTGIPKGVVFLHGMFKAQIQAMKRELNIVEGEIHLAAMYIFALFNPALGVTTVIPDMDPGKTEKLKPERLVEAIETFGVTMSLGSPTVWRLVNAYCRKHNITLDSIKHIFMFGAPVYPSLLSEFSKIINRGSVFTPYGATEALPLTNIDAAEILNDTREATESGQGVCVGKAIQGVEICITRLTDQPYETMTPEILCDQGSWGEVTARGDMVTETYLNRPEQTREAKIPDGETLWHRMGDVGYLDEKNRLWICGRKAHRVETEHGLLMPVCCEVIFNAHPGVFRSALIGLGPGPHQKPVVIIETHHPISRAEFTLLTRELKLMARENPVTRHIDTFMHHPKFPMDVRHNAKIQRQILKQWAEAKV